MWSSFIENKLNQCHMQEQWRERVINQGADGRFIYLDDNIEPALNFSSNDYLGLSQHPHIIKAWISGAQKYGVGSGGSGHVTGYTQAHYELEQSLAGWLGYSRALLFISGYSANQAVIHALMGANDQIIADKLSHASLLEATLHSSAHFKRFLHNDCISLARTLQHASTSHKKTLVVTEGVFSMDGDSAPLKSINKLTNEYNGWLMVDDAHGIGIKGQQGRGSCYLEAIKPQILVVTFGKAFGLSGAAVLCDNSTADYFIQCARHLIYSTNMPAAQAVALQAALDVITQGDDLRQQLNDNIKFFRNQAKQLPFRLSSSDSAIQPIIIGDNARALQLALRLQNKGIWAKAIRPPTVPINTARLRITLTAKHTRNDIVRLLEVLDDCN